MFPISYCITCYFIQVISITYIMQLYNLLIHSNHSQDISVSIFHCMHYQVTQSCPGYLESGGGGGG